MESLSGPLHSRKLSNGNGFSNKNAYDGLFSGQRKFGSPNLSARTEDYREIFGSSQGVSSIPVLDLSGFDDPNGSSNLRSSKPDYSNIFGGFRDDDDGAVFYEELFGRVNGVKNSPEKARTTSARTQPSEDSEDMFDTSNQSEDALKQFNVSYHKATQKSKDGLNGTTHVAQLHDVPGFTCFIDEIKMASSLKAEAGTQKSSAENGIHPKSDGRPEVKNSKKGYKQISGSAVKSKSRSSRSGSFSDDKLFNAYEINVKSQPSKLPSPSFMPPYSENHQARSNGPVASNSGAPEIDVSESDEELDVNSAAAASVAALKKAIEKAQESIRIAKESVGRRKEGLRSFSNKSFKDSLKVKGREATYKNVEREYGRVDAASEVFDFMERKNVRPDFNDGEKLFVARKVIDEIHGKISESARQRERSPWSAPELKENERVSVSREVRDETTGRNRESIEKLEASTRSFEHVNVEKGSTVSAFEPPFSGNNVLESADYQESKPEIRTTNNTLEEQSFVKKLDAVKISCELKDMEQKPNIEVRVHRIESSSLVDEERGNWLPSSKQEEQEVLEKPHGFFKLVNFVKNFRGFVETMEDEKKVSNKLKDDNGYKVTVNEAHNFFQDETKLNDSREMMEKEQKDRDYEKRLNQASEQFEIGNEQEEVLEEDIEKAENLNHASEQFEIGNEQEEVLEENIEKAENERKDCDHDVNEKIFEKVSQWVENEPKESDVSNGSKKEDTHKEEAIEKWLDKVHELEINEMAQTFVHDMKESEVSLQDGNQKEEETEKYSEERDANDEKDSEETLKEKCEWAGEDDVVTEDYICKEEETTARGTDGNEENREIEMSQKVDYEEIFARDFDGFNHDTSNIAVETEDTCKVKDNKVEAGQEANDSGRRPEVREEEAEVVEVSNMMQENEIFEAASQTSTENDEREFEVKEVHESFSSKDYEGKYDLPDKEVAVNDIGQTDEQSDFVADVTEAVSNETIENEVIKEEVKFVFPQEEKKLFPKRAHWDLENPRLPSIPKEKEQTVEIKDEFKRSQYREKSENLSRTMEDKKDEVKKVEEKKQLKDLDEATKRQREREKDRMVVERAIREARERAFAEARERAERAAVERATDEVRQRVLAEAREKIERVSAGTTKSSTEKASAEAKIRAERAAVERATAEARERALVKAMSQKTTTSERFVGENFSGASRDAGIRQSSSADLHGSSGTNSESAQRSKARLERHNRIMERAAKALAEKENRDLLAQREQAERNRLAETLDAEIKRWSSGKLGNLRALLSTLQYILGSNSGWQPVTLTEIITTSAVKKAYRKATLVVHPDKVQQRGASIQQKYICEKVFDLLKAAWNKFNSEER